MDSEIFAQLPPTKLFFRCAVPAVVTSVFGALYSVVDGLFVGRFLGEDALAAINLIMPVIMIVEALSNMIATGASVNISMLLGERGREEASRVFSFSVKFILLLSCVLGLLGFFFAKPFITLLAPGASETAIQFSVEYLRVYALFGPLIPIYFATDNYLRVCGRQKLSMWIGVVTQGLNVVLDFVLIAVLHRGVRAAAVASCVSIALGSVITLLLFMGKRMDLYYTREGIPAARFFRIAANGSSEFFSSIAMSIMSVVYNLFLLKHGGTTAVAAFSIVMYVDSIIGMLNFGICDSLQPAISYCYGAGMIERMKAIFSRVLIATVITAVAAFLFMLLAGPSVASIFIKPGDTELAAVSKTAIRLFSFSYPAGWIDMCFSSYFTALDRPVRSLLVSFFGTLVLQAFAHRNISSDLHPLREDGVIEIRALVDFAQLIYVNIFPKPVK
ncbi:MAG: MATE family efflux transporter [Ruminococcaceae bacterium]|nr:MATE family efflux transporter [Oscillospiraceae bacterium]